MEPVYFDFFQSVICVCGVSPSEESIFRILIFLRSHFFLWGLPFGGIHFQDSIFFEEWFLSARSPFGGIHFQDSDFFEELFLSVGSGPSTSSTEWLLVRKQHFSTDSGLVPDWSDFPDWFRTGSGLFRPIQTCIFKKYALISNSGLLFRTGTSLEI